jgi:hypothetical protein
MMENIEPYDKKVFAILKKQLAPYFTKIHHTKAITAKHQDLRYTRDCYDFVSEPSEIHSEFRISVVVNSSYYTYNTVSRDPDEHKVFFVFNINGRQIQSNSTDNITDAAIEIGKLANKLKEIKDQQDHYKNEVIKLQSILTKQLAAKSIEQYKDVYEALADK